MNIQHLNLEYIFNKKRSFANNKIDVFNFYKEWFETNTSNRNLNTELALFLDNIITSNDLERYQFALFTIQTQCIDFSENDDHFSSLFKIANSLLIDLENNEQKATIYWLLNMLMDISIHHSDELDNVVKNAPKLIPEFLYYISKLNYDENDGQTDISLAVYHSVNLIWHLPINETRNSIIQTFLNHFDSAVVEETQELIEHLKEDNKY